MYGTWYLQYTWITYMSVKNSDFSSSNEEHFYCHKNQINLKFETEEREVRVLYRSLSTRFFFCLQVKNFNFDDATFLPFEFLSLVDINFLYVRRVYGTLGGCRKFTDKCSRCTLNVFVLYWIYTYKSRTYKKKK